MKIVIFTGGTGSVALQTGLYELYGDDIEVNCIFNAYDNGLSTGLVRQVFDGKILGPSDLRKNQILRHKLKYGQTKLLDFLDIRFSVEQDAAEEYCLNRLKTLDWADKHVESIFNRAIKFYFNQQKALQITYDDFSISNIIYAGLAGQFNNSLEMAGIEMAKLLGIEEDAVILSSDESLFLQALTKSGYTILDEGDIVNWNNPDDPIIDIKLVDIGGCERLPQLTPRAQNAMLDADIIILSSGTQWSSLIPTYVCTNFSDTLEHSKAFNNKALYCIINNVQDKDMTGLNVREMIDIVDRYIPKEHIKFIFNKNASDEMSINNLIKDETDIASHCYSYTLTAEKGDKKHHAQSLAWAIMHQFYNKYILNDTFVFDYDDTIVGRNSEYFNESHANRSLLWRLSSNKNVNIITGNAEKHINLDFNNSFVGKKTQNLSMYINHNSKIGEIGLYADGGINKFSAGQYEVDTFSRLGIDTKFIECIDKELRMNNDEVKRIITKIENIGIGVNKIQNRNNITISVKPIDDEYRKPISILLQQYLGNEYFIRPTGRTTIDISKSGTLKTKALNDIIKDMDKDCKVVYIGDEGFDGGNDYELTHHQNVHFLHVKNPRDTLIFLKTLILTHENKNHKMLGRGI